MRVTTGRWKVLHEIYQDETKAPPTRVIHKNKWKVKHPAFKFTDQPSERLSYKNTNWPKNKECVCKPNLPYCPQKAGRYQLSHQLKWIHPHCASLSLFHYPLVFCSYLLFCHVFRFRLNIVLSGETCLNNRQNRCGFRLRRWERGGRFVSFSLIGKRLQSENRGTSAYHLTALQKFGDCAAAIN